MQLKEIARRSVTLLDLTSLGDRDTTEMIDTLCRRALRYRVAAVCVWPRFMVQCAGILNGSPINLATVVNFPDGDSNVDSVVKHTEQCIQDGADEIDLVMPYNAWLKGNVKVAEEMISAVKQSCGSACLKVILETGRIKSHDRIVAASQMAINAGADFLKTSTGKGPVSATPSAARAMFEVIQQTDRPVGFKAAGGIRSLRQAANYLRIADRFMGRDWVTGGHFRFGASSLLDSCIPFLNESA